MKFCRPFSIDPIFNFVFKVWSDNGFSTKSEIFRKIENIYICALMNLGYQFYLVKVSWYLGVRMSVLASGGLPTNVIEITDVLRVTTVP